MIKFQGVEFGADFPQRKDENFLQAQKIIDSEVVRLSDPYVPFRHGDLKKSGISGTVLGSGVIKYTAPYARAQYYNNAGHGEEGVDALDGAKGLRGKLWFERMKADHKDEILEKVSKIK